MRVEIILVLAATVLVAGHSQAALAQRSSPQFSFPPPTSDLFSTGAQDPTGLAPSGQQQSSSQAQSQQEQPQLVAQSLPQQPQQSPPRQQLNPLSGGSLSGHSQQTANAQRQAQTQPHSIAAPSNHQSQQAPNRPRQQPQQHSAPASRPHHVSTHAGGSSSSSRDHQSSIEAARKAEATAASLAASSGQTYQCPDSFGYFRHHKSCDKYWACENGTATLKLCGNGLMFDDSDPRRENCAYPFSVECGSDRVEVEPPISTPHCPRLYGLFADTSNCRIFYSCWNGEASKYECPAGLAYDNEHRVCVWADHVDRCDQSEISDGFVCPDATEADQPGHYTRHAHPTDCRKFYVCIDGVARPYGCSIGTVFNVDSLQCDEPENVSGCEKYYGDMDPKLAKKLARENVQQSSGSPPTRSTSSSHSSSNSGGQQGGRSSSSANN